MEFKLSYSVQFSSVAQSCLTLCDPMNHSTPGLPIHHQLLESTQTHVHLVGDAIQPSHPLLSPSPALNLAQHQGLFKWVSSSHQVAKVLSYFKDWKWCCESAALNMPANLENSKVATGLEKVSFHSNPKERQCQRMLKLPHNCTHLDWSGLAAAAAAAAHASKVMLKILQARKYQ